MDVMREQGQISRRDCVVTVLSTAFQGPELAEGRLRLIGPERCPGPVSHTETCPELSGDTRRKRMKARDSCQTDAISRGSGDRDRVDAGQHMLSMRIPNGDTLGRPMVPNNAPPPPRASRAMARLRFGICCHVIPTSVAAGLR